MKYSLITDTKASSESFNTLKKAIPELYPDFSFERTIKAEGESETAIYAKGDERICAELNYEKHEVRVSSDIPLLELAELFKLSKKAAKAEPLSLPPSIAMAANFVSETEKKPLYRHCTKEYKSGRFGLHLFKSPIFWKYVMIPALLMFASAIIYIIEYLPYFSFSTLLLPVFLSALMVRIFAPALGWIWFIPALPAAIAAARFKKGKLYKLIVTAMPLLSTVRLCIAYPDICAEAYDSMPYIPQVLFLSFEAVILLLIMYVLALPYMITDDIAGAFCEDSGGKRPRKLFSALCWTVSVIVSVTAVCVSGYFASVENKREESEYITAITEERKEQSREYDRIYEEYGADMTAAAEYSAEHRYYDWYNCPEPEMKPVWERLFLSGNASGSLSFSKEEGCVRISFGSSFNYYIYTDTNEVRYDGKTIPYGGETV